MMNLHKAGRSWGMLLTALALAVMFSLLGMASPVQAATAPALQQDDGSSRGNDDIEVYGRIEAMPQSGLIGQWTVGGAVYTTTAETEYKREEGPIELGACVKLSLKSDGVTVREMDSEPGSDCNGGGDDNGGNDENKGREFYGSVEAMPSGSLIGQWTISSAVYTVTAQTEIKQRFGTIEIGSCVEVQLTKDGSAVRELQSKRDAYCNRSDDDNNDGSVLGRGELYGELVSFPATLVGVWQIGAITLTADINTEFQQRNGPFTVGEYVKAEFRIQADGTFVAREIKTINTRDGGDDDNGGDDNNGRNHDGKAFGIIESVANGNLGVWQISGISYTVTADTKLDDDRGALAVGQTVKVEYSRDSQGNRTASEVKAMPERAGNPAELRKLYGYVQALPADGFVGDWTVDGVAFAANASSKFEEEHGILTTGAFVEVKYVMQEGVRLIVKMETHVLPGGGDDDFFGRVERMDDSLAAAAVSATWTIGGRNYVVTDATDVSNSVAVGGTAVVNSYAAADGSQVATRISSVTLDNTLYLPTAIK